MVQKWDITIPELSGDETRKAYVYLPTSYDENDETRYPVLYMFDGHNLFFDEEATYGKSWGLADYLDYTDTPLIVAAQECSHAPNHARISEYSPFSFYDPMFGDIVGRGDTTMRWFIDEFKPYVDENFRTLPDRETTFIGGSSMGGLMSLYALVAYNDVFSRAAALSPAISFVHRDLYNVVKERDIDWETTLYMDYGSDELGSKRTLKNFARFTRLFMEMGVAVTSRVIPRGTHSEESWERQLPFVIPTLMYGL